MNGTWQTVIVGGGPQNWTCTAVSSDSRVIIVGAYGRYLRNHTYVSLIPVGSQWYPRWCDFLSSCKTYYIILFCSSLPIPPSHLSSHNPLFPPPRRFFICFQRLWRHVHSRRRSGHRQLDLPGFSRFRIDRLGVGLRWFHLEICDPTFYLRTRSRRTAWYFFQCMSIGQWMWYVFDSRPASHTYTRWLCKWMFSIITYML